MIIGIGTDLVDIRRIERLLERFGERFTAKYFTTGERNYAESKRRGGGHVDAYAKRFAAKEACAKALGTGFRHGIAMKDIEVRHDHNRRPILKLSGHAHNHLASKIPDGMKTVLHLSLSDEKAYAHAFVIIETLEKV